MPRHNRLLVALLVLGLLGLFALAWSAIRSTGASERTATEAIHKLDTAIAKIDAAQRQAECVRSVVSDLDGEFSRQLAQTIDAAFARDDARARAAAYRLSHQVDRATEIARRCPTSVSP